MRYLVGFVFVLALGALRVAGCGEESSIPCDPDLRAEDCPDDGDECTGVTCPVDIAVCRYHVVAHTIGAGCALSDGSVGYCDILTGCTKTAGSISCKHGYNNQADWPDGTLCRSPDGLEGTCLDGLCGGEYFCEGVVCDDPDNLCESDQFCNWEGVCEFRQVTQCYDGNSCTVDECDPDKGCVYTQRPNGADCAPNGLCCLLTGAPECCDGSCTDGICLQR